MDLEPITRLSRDQRAAGALLGDAEARYLVDTYYQMQDSRIATAHQRRAAGESGEPNATLTWAADQFETLEGQIRGVLGRYAKQHPAGKWALGQKGVGPVITAGLVARLELRPTVGQWWKFCGLDPSVTWEKGQKRPWNAALKRLCWLLGESFVKVSGYDDAFYGQLYKARKEEEVARNEAGAFADQAARVLATKNIGRDTQARAYYEAGKLPPAHVHARAKRWAVKIFLAHLHDVWHRAEKGVPAPEPYVIERAIEMDNSRDNERARADDNSRYLERAH